MQLLFNRLGEPEQYVGPDAPASMEVEAGVIRISLTEEQARSILLAKGPLGWEEFDQVKEKVQKAMDAKKQNIERKPK